MLAQYGADVGVGVGLGVVEDEEAVVDAQPKAVWMAGSANRYCTTIMCHNCTGAVVWGGDMTSSV